MKWPGFSDIGTVIINVPSPLKQMSKKSIWYKDERYEPKDEFHITIFGKELGAQLRPLESKIAKAFETTNWEFLIKDEMYHIKKDEKQSIIIMVQLDGLDIFFKEITKISGKPHTKGPAHITVYTRGEPLGIGLPSMQAFEQYKTAKITFNDLRANQ